MTAVCDKRPPCYTASRHIMIYFWQHPPSWTADNKALPPNNGPHRSLIKTLTHSYNTARAAVDWLISTYVTKAQLSIMTHTAQCSCKRSTINESLYVPYLCLSQNIPILEVSHLFSVCQCSDISTIKGVKKSISMGWQILYIIYRIYVRTEVHILGFYGFCQCCSLICKQWRPNVQLPKDNENTPNQQWKEDIRDPWTPAKLTVLFISPDLSLNKRK